MANPALRAFEGWTQEQYQALASRLARHASTWLARYDLLTGDGSIQGGKTIEELVQDAISDTVTGKRKWNPQRHPDLEAYIKMVIVSKVRNLYKDKKRLLVVPLLDAEREADEEAGSTTVETLSSKKALISNDPQPDELLENQERGTQVVQLMYYLRAEIENSIRKQEDRDDMEYILMALEDENETPEEIEQVTGIPRDRIYRLLERIRELARRARDRFYREIGGGQG